MECFEAVYIAVAGSGVSTRTIDDVECAVEAARKNKVLLHFLRAAGLEGKLRDVEEARFRVFLEGLRIVAEALKGLDHVFIKLAKPVVYVPSDIDVLIRPGHLQRAVSLLQQRGFRIEVVEPYCVTLARGGLVVDLYVQPTLGNVVYLDARRLFEYATFDSIFGLDFELPLLERRVEALLAAAHAVYKEKVYTLNDYVTVRRWMTRSALRLAYEFNVTGAVRLAASLNSLVERGVIVLPYRVPLGRWLLLWAAKLASDPVARATMPGVVRAALDRRFGALVLSKFTRESY